MATNNTKTVEVKPMELETVSFSIVGTTPLIVHAWDEKAKRMMLDKQMGKSKKTKHDIKVPTNDFMASLYWITDKPEDGSDEEEAKGNFDEAVSNGAKFGFPLGGIKQAIITGASRGGLDVKMTELRGSFFLEGGTEASTFDLAEIVGSAPVMREDMVRVGGASKTADIRHRASFKSWSIPLKLTYNKNGKYSLDQLLNCVNVSGFVTGIGEWRPEKDGQMGMYMLKL